MIVADKEKSVSKANEISIELLQVLADKCSKFNSEDDPAENVYLFVHSISLLNIKICLALENYSLIYGIDKMNKETIFEWIRKATLEYFKSYKEKTND